MSALALAAALAVALFVVLLVAVSIAIALATADRGQHGVMHLARGVHWRRYERYVQLSPDERRIWREQVRATKENACV